MHWRKSEQDLFRFNLVWTCFCNRFDFAGILISENNEQNVAVCSYFKLRCQLLVVSFVRIGKKFVNTDIIPNSNWWSNSHKMQKQIMLKKQTFSRCQFLSCPWSPFPPESTTGYRCNETKRRSLLTPPIPYAYIL